MAVMKMEPIPADRVRGGVRPVQAANLSQGCKTDTNIHSHSHLGAVEIESACLWAMKGNWRTWKQPTQAQRNIRRFILDTTTNFSNLSKQI